VRYTYRGDRLTDLKFKGMQCDPVRQRDGKCVRGRNGSMLVVDANGTEHVVIGRMLRINKTEEVQACAE
jgi:hypothetical protein